jgi:hypothetical protein
LARKANRLGEKNMNRDELLAAKREEIQAELDRWVKENSILNAGERIVLSIHIEEVPIVIQENGREILDLPIPLFFTEERFRQCRQPDMELSLVSRVRNQLYGSEGARVAHPDRYFSTVQDVIELGRGGLRKRSNIGEKTLECIELMLEAEGMTLPD